MPFQKGNQLGKANADPAHNKRGQWNNIVGWLVGDGGNAYKELIAKQAAGEEIKKPQQEFMDRFEGLLEYHQPKLARQEVDHTSLGEKIGTVVYVPKKEL